MSKYTKEVWMVGGRNKCTIYDSYGQRVADSFEGVMVTQRSDADCQSNARLIAAAPELLEALEAYQTAQAMPEYGDYSSFEVAKRTMRYEGKPEWGHICEKHGLGYDGRCLCCEDDFKRHRADNDRKARNARDDALREAERKAAAAIAKAKGEQ